MDKKERCIYNDCSYCTATFEDSSELMNLLGENSHLKKHCSTLEIEVDQLERRFKGLEIEIDKVKHEKTIYQALRDIESSQNTIFERENEKLKEALRKCDPFIAHTGSRLHVCESCFDNPHADDCEYVKLTK